MNANPRPLIRLASAGYYLGLAPIINLWRPASSDPFLRRHLSYAMSGLFVLLLWFVTVLCFDIAEWIAIVHLPDFTPNKGWVSYVAYVAWVCLAVLGLLWITLVGLALAGSAWEVPLLNRFARKTWMIRVSFVANSLALALIPVVGALTVHATSLTRTNREAAAVYFLYDEGIPVPRCAYALWSYRVSLQARRQWGEGSTVLDRLNKETLRTALMHGKVVILATHGGDGYVCTWYAPEKLGIFPPDHGTVNKAPGSRFLWTSVLGPDDKWRPMETVDVNSALRLIYIFGCDVGKKASQWQEHVLPAEVIAYNRWSTVFDHALWFGLAGPAQLKNLR